MPFCFSQTNSRDLRRDQDPTLSGSLLPECSGTSICLLQLEWGMTSESSVPIFLPHGNPSKRRASDWACALRSPSAFQKVFESYIRHKPIVIWRAFRTTSRYIEVEQNDSVRNVRACSAVRP
eukprot:4051802-Amphidinium_carterae.2